MKNSNSNNNVKNAKTTTDAQEKTSTDTQAKNSKNCGKGCGSSKSPKDCK